MSAAVDRFREILKRYIGKSELVEVYEDSEDTDKFEVGFVLSVSEESYSLARIDTKGRPDGSFVGRIDDIVRLALGTQYLSSIQLLNERFRAGDRFGSSGNNAGPFDDIYDLVKYVHQNRILVSVSADVYFYGFITDFSKEHIEILEVNKSGIEDGYQFLDMDEINRIDFGGPSEDARKFLHQVRMGL